MKKRLLCILMSLLLYVSTIPMSANAENAAGTYCDGKTLKMENFYDIHFTTKVISKYNEKVVQEYYEYEYHSFGPVNKELSFVASFYDDYLSENGWNIIFQGNNGYVNLYKYANGNFHIDIEIHHDKGTVRFWFINEDYYKHFEEWQDTAESNLGEPCGRNLYATFENGVITITGSGEMYNYNAVGDTPWYDKRESITKIILADGVTSIGDNAFAFMKELNEVDIQGSLKYIGTSAFEYCLNLKEIHYAGAQKQWIEISKEPEQFPEDIIIYFNDGTHMGLTEEEKEAEARTRQIRMTIGSNVANVYGNNLIMDVAPQIINGRTMLPARYVTENLGGGIEWIEEYNMVAVTVDSYALLFKIGSDSASFLGIFDENNEEAFGALNFGHKAHQLKEIFPNSNTEVNNFEWANSYVYNYKASQDDFYNRCAMNQSTISLDVAPVIIDGRTFMPVRVIATFLSADVTWDADTQTVIIEKMKQGDN